MRQGLPAHPSSVGRARRLVRAHLMGTPLERLAETAELVVSEVVTNAIVHTGTDIELTTLLDDRGLRVEVYDSGRHLPVVASYTALASTGRGLHLVAELTDQWGVEASPDGKVFWFHIGGDQRDSDPRGVDATASAEQDGRGNQVDPVTVVLLNLPTLIHGAWQQHAKSLLRDLLLLGIEGAASHEIEAHAAAMDALALLEEQLGAWEISEDPTEILISAAEPHVTRLTVDVAVPRESVPHFRLLDTQLDSALAHAAAGRLLTPATQPELTAFRRWLCEQVRVQAEGAPPRPWTTPALPRDAQSDPTTTDDVSALLDSPRSLVGVDHAGLMVAASPSAAALLGYGAPSEMVGRRLVEIIPARYHQAHLAGFTLHHITGRSPLLDRTVSVPVRCRDDSEVEVRLTITASITTAGRSIFVADLESD